MTGPGCGWSKISRVQAPYDNLGPAVKPLQSPESAVYIMDSLLDSLKLPQSFNSHPFSLVICFDNITPRAHKFLAGERHSSTLRSCAALEPNLSESREIRFFRRSLPAAKVSAEQARKCMPTRMRARGTGQWWHILARSTMEFPVRQRQPTIWPWSRRFAPQ